MGGSAPCEDRHGSPDVCGRSGHRCANRRRRVPRGAFANVREQDLEHCSMMSARVISCEMSERLDASKANTLIRASHELDGLVEPLGALSALREPECQT